MAIIQEYPYVDENGRKHRNLIRHYSDIGLKLRQLETNSLYDEAVDLYPCTKHYMETNMPIEVDSDAQEN